MDEKARPRKTFIIAEPDAGQRIDAWLAARIDDLTRNQARKRIDEGAVRVNGESAKANHKLREGERIEIELPPPEPGEPQPEDIPLDVVFEDEHLIVVNKPSGMVTHPAPGHAGGTLVNALLAHCGNLPGANDERRPGIVHRLDRDTSGLLAAAKSEAARAALSDALERREISRHYSAVALGQPKNSEGTVEAPIGRSRNDRKKMAITPNGRPAVTHWSVDFWGPGVTAMKIKLETGRTHQIRVHLASIGHPVVGDRVYGWTRKREIENVPHKESDLIQALSRVERQMLHAESLQFAHPMDGRALRFDAPIPDDMANLIQAIRPLQTREELEREARERHGQTQ